MMKNRTWLRIVSLVLASVCLISVMTAAAADLSGKVTVWDLQKAVNEGKSKEEKLSVLAALLGGGDELHPNTEGVYEIWSELGLRNLVKHASEGCNFKLMKNIDLGGEDWPLVKTFCGTFDGGNFTISNFNIKETSNDRMGFFAEIANNGTDAEGNVIQSEIKNLKLENVTLTVPVDSTARYIGLVAGNNQGIIRDCSVVGTINDARTTLSKACYFGAIAGNNSTTTKGVVYATNGMTVRDTCTTYTHTQKVNSMLAIHAADLAEGSSSRHVGIVGYSDGKYLINSATQKTGTSSNLYWQDITNSTTLVSKTLQDRRAKVVDYMYEMCTVEWSPSVTMKYSVYKPSYSSTTYTAGNTYKGIPYNHGSSGMDRFQAYLENPTYTEAYYFTDAGVINALNNNTPDAEGYVTVTAENYGKSTPNEKYVGTQVKVPVDWVKGTTGTILTGFGRFMGNDCSSAANWAWRQISANDSNTEGFAEMRSTSTMIPTQDNIKKFGIQAVNGLAFDAAPEDLNGDKTVNNADYGLFLDSVFAADKQAFYRVLAGTSKGDVLVGYNSAGGHTRVAAGDAVVIYKVKSGGSGSELDPKLSYVVTHEQGRNSSGSGWSSSCTVNYQYTFDMLTNYKNYNNIGVKCTYIPVTCAALRQEDTPAATAWCEMKDGVITSNYHIVSTTVGAETVYTNTAALTGSRAPCLSVTAANVHSAAGNEVTVLLSNGETYSFPYGG